MPPTLLVVDDDPMVAALVGAALRRDGIRVVGVSTVASALAAVWGERPDVILTDLYLTDGSGLEVIRAAAAVAGYDPRVVLSSGVPEGDLRRLAASVGADHLAKPFDVVALRKSTAPVASGQGSRPSPS